MNPARPPPAPKKEVQLQGPRPSPLKVNKDSVKIKKPPPHPHPHPASTQHRPPPPPPQPVVIYSVSPKVIHTTENEFMSLIQRLTGPSTPSPSSSPDGLSPAARLASVHKTSPNSTSGHNKPVTTTTSISTSTDDDFMASIFNIPEDQGGGGGSGGSVQLDEMGQFPGILSPPPASLPAVTSEFFSQHHQYDVISSPMLNNWMGMTFSPGPSSAIISPSPCSWDLFNNFLHNF
ncbi:protein MKS1 [Pyrus x bretschneideri]|uniref:protein MKS1 n=1 Tax=Pyrus x bretschneideri TaxID=225117 RepID=UPI00202E0DF8|nr:protein MKS1 [Pyrus x bretschneideri]